MIRTVLVRSAATDVLRNVGGDPDDAVLVTQCLSNELQVRERARTKLVRRYDKLVYGLAYLMMKNRHDAEDAAQGTFEKVFKKLHRYRSTGPLQAWVMTTCRNHCLDLHRCGARAGRSPVSLDDLDLADRANAVDLDLAIDVQTLIKTLPRAEQEALYFYLLGYTSREAADSKKTAPSTIRSRLSRALDKLGRELRGNVA